MDLQETIVLRIQRESGSHLATNYEPKGLQWTSHASSERCQWRWWTPSEMVSRLDLVVLDSAAAEIDFRRLVSGFWHIGVFIKQRGGPWSTRGGHNPLGHAWAYWRALVLCPLLGAPPGAARAHHMSSGPSKISVKFPGIWTPFGIDFLQCKNMQKTATGTGHYVNRLVPKMI